MKILSILSLLIGYGLITHIWAIWRAKEDTITYIRGEKQQHFIWALYRSFLTIFVASLSSWAFPNPYLGVAAICAYMSAYYWIAFDYMYNKSIGQKPNFIGSTAWDDRIFCGSWVGQYLTKLILFAWSFYAVMYFYL